MFKKIILQSFTFAKQHHNRNIFPRKFTEQWVYLSTINNPLKVATFEDVKNVKENVYLIDVREPAELQQTGALPKSLNIPLNQIEQEFKAASPEHFKSKYGCSFPQRDSAIILSCKAGIRSNKALKIIETLGFTNVRNYEGGWDDWEEQMKQNK